MATETWEDSASCIVMSENPLNRDHLQGTFLCDVVRDGHVKLVKCPGLQNVSSPLSKKY